MEHQLKLHTLLLLLLRGWWRTLKSFTDWRIVSAGGHESAKVSLVKSNIIDNMQRKHILLASKSKHIPRHHTLKYAAISRQIKSSKYRSTVNDAEMRNFSAAECGTAIRGTLRNVPHSIFCKLPLTTFRIPQSAFRKIPAPLTGLWYLAVSAYRQKNGRCVVVVPIYGPVR